MSKYKKPLIVFGIYIALGLLLALTVTFLEGADIEISPILPGETQNVELIFLFLIFYPLAAIIGGILAGYAFTPLFFFVHKKIIGRKMVFGIEERPDPEKFKQTFRGFFPALMALNFALIIHW